MSTPANLQALRRSLAALAGLQLVPQAAPVLATTIEQATAALRSAILAEIPAFQTSGNPQVLPGLSAHVEAHVEAIHGLFGGHGPDDFAFVKDHARLRAEQHFPLEVMLQAYRCGHRSLSHWLRGAVLALKPARVEQAVAAVADFAIEYTNVVSNIAAAEYVARTRLLAEAESDQRTELLSILLQGYDEADGRVTTLLKRAGYLAQRQAYCVVVAQPVNVAEMEHPERPRRIIATVSDALANTSIRILAGVRNNMLTFVLSDLRRQSGWTAAQSGLADRIHPLLDVLGTSVLAGISADHPSTSFLPQALGEAAIALDLASVTARCVKFTGIPVRGLLVHRGANAVKATPPAWLPAFIAADTEASGNLLATLRAFAACDMNMQRAARQLGKHPNTLYARLVRIRDLTGLDAQRYPALTEILLTADCWGA